MKAIVAKISETNKSAVIMLQTSPFSMERTPVYIPNAGYTVKQEIVIPDNHKIVDWTDHKTKDGKQLKTLSL